MLTHTVLDAVPLQFIPSEKLLVAVQYFIRQKAVAAKVVYAAQLRYSR